MTDCGKYGICLFGGEGKRLSNAVHVLDPSNGSFVCLQTTGVRTHSQFLHAHLLLIRHGLSSQTRLLWEANNLRGHAMQEKAAFQLQYIYIKQSETHNA